LGARLRYERGYRNRASLPTNLDAARTKSRVVARGKPDSNTTLDCIQKQYTFIDRSTLACVFAGRESSPRAASIEPGFASGSLAPASNPHSVRAQGNQVEIVSYVLPGDSPPLRNQCGVDFDNKLITATPAMINAMRSLLAYPNFDRRNANR